MKKYQYLASWDDQTLTRVGEPVVVLGDSNVSQVEVIMPSNFLLDPTGAVARMYFLLPGEKESGFETLETATKDENGDSHVTWTIKHAHTQKGGRLAFSLTLIGDDAQWDSRTAIIPVYESRYQPESEEAEEPYTGRLDALEGSMASIRGEFAEVQEDFEDLKETATLGTPIPESLVANMTEGHVYIYTGTEPGYTAGHVYYYVGGALTDGGVYGGTAVDATLTQSGQAADAKKTGDEISAIKEDLSAVEEDSLTEIPFKQTLIKGSYIGTADGITHSNDKYARTSLIDVGDSKCISISNANYQMRVAYYSGDGNVSTGSGYLGNSDYVDSFKDVDFPSNAIIFGVTFRRTDQTNLTDNDISAITNAIKIKTVKANAALNAIDGLAAEYTVVNKNSGSIIDYYVSATGEIKSSSIVVKTLCLPCKPCETYRIRHSKSTRFVIASFVTQPRLRLFAQKVYDGRNETVTVFTTDSNANWLGIWYYSATENNPLTPEETYNALKIEIVDNVAVSTTPSCYTVNNAIELPKTYEGVIALYDALVAARPDYVTKNALTSGDLTNYEYVFSTGNYNKYTGARRDPDPAITKPTILLTSGVHGYERSAVVSLYLLMRDLCDNNYALTDLLNYVNIRVIPVGCPWGYTNNSRLNANGVNINRNFATSAWGDTDPGTPGSVDYAGPSAGSEDETKIIQNWMQAHSNALFYTDFHNSNFSQEVVTLGGPDTEECVLFKKQFLLAINRVIPYWQKERGIGSNNNMYCYAGGSGTIQDRHSRHYAYEVGIHKAFYCETSWNINGTGKHSIETFLVGAEAMGNFLVGMKKYYEDI